MTCKIIRKRQMSSQHRDSHNNKAKENDRLIEFYSVRISANRNCQACIGGLTYWLTSLGIQLSK